MSKFFVKRLMIGLFLVVCSGTSGLAVEQKPAIAINIKGSPKGVLSEQKTKALWNAYKKAKKCFEHPTYGGGFPIKVSVIKPGAASSITLKSVFLSGRGIQACDAGRRIYEAAPKPIITVELNEAYGQQQTLTKLALHWFSRASAAARFDPASEWPKAIKSALIAWAEADALHKGINVSWGSKPVDWQHICLILSLLHATEAVADRLTEDDRKIIIPWLSRLMAKVGASRWKDRQDNKAYQVAYGVGLWGAMTQDLKLVQAAVDVYRLAIHDMRPDGSFPIDTQRSGMGLDYNAKSVSNLIMIAGLAKNIGIELSEYAVDGRSLHSAVDFVVEGINGPKLNKKYAISCPEGGDRWGSIEFPATYYAQGDGTVLYVTPLFVYSASFPDVKASKQIVARYGSSRSQSLLAESIGAVPACLFPRPTK